jgi:hypothetical protein
VDASRSVHAAQLNKHNKSSFGYQAKAAFYPPADLCHWLEGK